MELSPNNTYQAINLLEQYFFHQKAMFYQHMKYRFFSIVLKICNSSFT